MRALIIFMSRHGSTEKVALYLQQHLPFAADLWQLHPTAPTPDLQPYDMIMVGGSVYMGQVQPEIQEYCRKHQKQLLQKQLGLFICCMNEKKADEALQAAFPEELLNHAKATGIMGGELLFEKMSFLEKMIIRTVTGQKESVLQIKYAAIDQFAEAMAATETVINN